MTLRALARELGVSVRRVNRIAGELFPRPASQRFAPWRLSPEQAQAISTRLERDMPAVSAGRTEEEPNRLPGSAPRPTVAAFSLAREALRMRALADRILAGIGVTRNGFELVGQLAELLVARAFDGTQASAAQAGYDVVTPGGRTIQVKARLGAPGATGKQVFIRGFGPGSRPFDELVYLQFDPDYEVRWAVRFPIEVVQQLAAYVPHTNSWRLLMSAKLLALGEDVSPAIRAAYDAL